MSDTLEIGTAVALGGLVFSLHSFYTGHAGQLAHARSAPPDDPATAERLRDADILTGGFVLVVGGALALMTKSSHPLLLLALAFAVEGAYYHIVLSSDRSVTDDTASDDVGD